MIKLPNFKQEFEYENDFYLSCNNSRLAKFIAHYELFSMVQGLPGDMIECGVFKGISLIKFATFRNLMNNDNAYKIIGFDIFDRFPETKYIDDISIREKFINSAGNESISKNQLQDILRYKNLNNIELIEGDINFTVPKYVKDNPQLKISLLNLDTDIYEPAVTILNNFWDKLVKGGVLIIDDYGVFPGETKAVDDFFKDKNITILKFRYSKSPCYIIKY